MRTKAPLTCLAALAILLPQGLRAQLKFTVSPKNQPAETESAETMKAFSAINQKLARTTDKSASSCVNSYAVYQACKAGHAASAYGMRPDCTVTAVLPKINLVGIEFVFTHDAEAAALGPAPVGPVMPPETKARLPFTLAPPRQNVFPPKNQDAASGMMAVSIAGCSMNGDSIIMRNGPARISSGFMSQTRLSVVRPLYPEAAKAAHAHGVVVLRAVIAKDGSIHKLAVLSSTNRLFDRSAIDAVRQWRYKRFLLNCEPTEVLTTVTVSFPFPASGFGP